MRLLHSALYKLQHIVTDCDMPRAIFTGGAWEVDQQRINSGLKQCTRHMHKTIGLPMVFNRPGVAGAVL